MGTRLVTTLFLNKILAIFVGPAGYAVIGQFLNIVGVATTFAGGAVSVGVTKYTAEYYYDVHKQQNVWRSAGTISISSTIIISFLLILFHKSIAFSGLKDREYGYVFLWLAGSLIFFVVNNLLLAIINGKKAVQLYVVINIIGSVTSAVIAAVLAIKWGLKGALIAMMINQSLTFFVTVAICSRTSWFNFKLLWGTIDPSSAINLAKYSLMALVSSTVIPLAQILVRNHLGDTFGWEITGLWQAMVKISDTYLMLVTSTLSLYYLPRLSEIRNNQELKTEVWNGYKVIVPLVSTCALILYLARDQIIGILFTASFQPMRDLFALQMLGDVVKISSWLLAYLMIGRALVRTFIITEVVFSSLYVVLVKLYTPYFGLQGAIGAYLTNYAIYFIIMYIIMSRMLKIKTSENDHHNTK